MEGIMTAEEEDSDGAQDVVVEVVLVIRTFLMVLSINVAIHSPTSKPLGPRRSNHKHIRTQQR